MKSCPAMGLAWDKDSLSVIATVPGAYKEDYSSSFITDCANYYIANHSKVHRSTNELALKKEASWAAQD